MFLMRDWKIYSLVIYENEIDVSKVSEWNIVNLIASDGLVLLNLKISFSMVWMLRPFIFIEFITLII